MLQYLSVIIAERRTLLRGLLVSSILVYPFTFLPIVFKHGWDKQLLIQRIPESAVYTVGFCGMVVVMAILVNYHNLVTRKNLFDRPAFTALDFHGRIAGLGSITRELETCLLGKVDAYYYRLNLIDLEEKARLEIVPLIDIEDDKEIKKLLKRNLGFKENWMFGLTIPLPQKELDNEFYILAQLQRLSEQLSELNVKPIIINERELED